MYELSVFIDESGDFGKYDFHAPYYIISMLFHNQNSTIQEALLRLDTELSYLGYENSCIHTGPIIRREESYHDLSVSERRRIFNKMVSFIRQIDIRYKCFFIEKKQVSDVIDATGKLSKDISVFIQTHYQEFLSFDTIKIYYDNGQIEVSKFLSSVFHSLLPNVEFRRVFPTQYRLFQAADLLCSIQLIELKMDNHILSKSEMNFFGNSRDLKKNYIKPLKKKEWL